jgi:hypothetical protein
MTAVSQKELDKIASIPSPVETGSPAAPAFRKFAALYNKKFTSDDSCALTQDEVDRVLATKK